MNKIFIILMVVFIGWWIYQTLVENYLEQDPDVVRLKNKLLPFFPEISRTVVLKGKKSYTIGKYKIYLCTVDEHNTVYDDNMLTYVFLHELAHCINTELGHGDSFQTIFQSLLNRAERFNLYNPALPKIKNYCMFNK